MQTDAHMRCIAVTPGPYYPRGNLKPFRLYGINRNPRQIRLSLLTTTYPVHGFQNAATLKRSNGPLTGALNELLLRASGLRLLANVVEDLNGERRG